jgi:hypothetical protein
MFDHDPRSGEPVKALACGSRVGVGECCHHAGRSGGDQRFGTGRATVAFMRAGLQTDIGGGTFGLALPACASATASACGRPPDWVQPRPMTTPVFDDDATDRGIVAGQPLAAFGKRDGGGEPAPVFARNFGYDGYFDAPTRAAMFASALARRSASSFCASASRVSTSMPTALPKAL